MNRRVVTFVLAFWAGLSLPAVTRGQSNYHNGENLICSDCHTVHYSIQHSYAGGAPDTAPAAGGPFDNLLRAGSADALCLTCHDGQAFAPDVRGDNTGSNVRQAGALPTGASPYEDWKGHTLGSTDTPPGGYMSGLGLSCINCHLQHGSTYYRNLPNGPTYAKGTNVLTKDVFLRKYYGDGNSTLAERYGVDNIDFNEPSSNVSKMASFCRGCHTDFHGTSSAPEMRNTSAPAGTEWFRHPTTDANIGALGDATHSSTAIFGSHAYRVKVLSSTGDWGTSGSTWGSPKTDLTPTCITCHKAHGNKNAFGLIYMDGSGPITEEGDAAGNDLNNGGGMRKLCLQCHVQQ